MVFIGSIRLMRVIRFSNSRCVKVFQMPAGNILMGTHKSCKSYLSYNTYLNKQL